MIIDVHAHLFPPAILEFYRKHGGDAVQVHDTASGIALIQRGRELHTRLPEQILDPEAHIAAMNAEGVDVHALSVPPPMVYWAQPDVAATLCEIANDELASIASKSQGRLVAMAILPMQSPELAVRELRRCVTEHGTKVVMVGTNVNGTELDSPALEAVFEAAAALNVAIFIHPITGEDLADRLFTYRLDLGLGMVLDTGIAMSKVVYSGLLDRYPDLRMGWSHLGGIVPFVVDRMNYFQERLPGSSNRAQHSYEDYLSRFMFDTVVYSPRTLEMGLQVFGSEQLMFGTDAPFLGDSTSDIRRILDAAPLLNPEQRSSIYATNPAAFLGLDSSVELATADAHRRQT